MTNLHSRASAESLLLFENASLADDSHSSHAGCAGHQTFSFLTELEWPKGWPDSGGGGGCFSLLHS